MRPKDEIMIEILSKIEDIIIQDYSYGSSNYKYVRIYPDGDVIAGEEPSESIPESEYFGKPNAPITIWSVNGFRESVGPDSGIFQWLEDETGEYIGDFDSGYFRCFNEYKPMPDKWKRFALDRSISGLVENLDLSEIESECENKLNDWMERSEDREGGAI